MLKLKKRGCLSCLPDIQSTVTNSQCNLIIIRFTKIVCYSLTRKEHIHALFLQFGALKRQSALGASVLKPVELQVPKKKIDVYRVHNLII